MFLLELGTLLSFSVNVHYVRILDSLVGIWGKEGGPCGSITHGLMILHLIEWVLMHTKELDMLIIQVEMELNLHKTLCHFLVAQLQDLEPNVSRKH